MGPDRQGDADEAANLTYPSPGAETMDAGPFYHATARDGAAEHAHQPDDQHVPQHVHPQDQDQAHAHLSPHDADQAHHHASRPSNLEELQLAAQLGDGLATSSMMPAADPSLDVEDHAIRNIMPHPEPEQHQTPPYVQEAPTADHMGQHAMPVPVGPPAPPQYQLNEGIPPRKRSKVSRACDECRRKKIKCDAQSDTGDAPCSSCARSSIRCLFSRVPQKRGPSKGYIKELADRIHSIENKLESEGNMSQDDIDKLFASERPRSHSQLGAVDDSSRKRPFSSISTTTEFTTPLTATRPPPWGSELRPLQPAPVTSEAFASQYAGSNGALAPQPVVAKADGTPSKPPVATMDAPMTDADELPDVDEAALDDYLASAQLLYPILPSSASRVQALLVQCPPCLRTAFSTALKSVGQGAPEDVAHADRLLHELESSNAPRIRAAEIVHAQTLLLLIIDADWQGLPTLPFLLARAVALANRMKLWRSAPTDTADPDSEDQLRVKIWWTLVLLDRWHAAGTGKPSQIPDNSVVAVAGLQATLGEVCFHIVRLSKLLNRMAFVISTLAHGATTAEEPMAGILHDYIENWREDLPPHVDAASYPLVHLAYWHCRLLVTLLTPRATAADAMWPTKELVNLLSLGTQLQTPLVNHFASLVLLSLTKLVKAESSRDEAAELARDIVDGPAGGVWDGVRERLAEQVRPPSSAEAAASQGLQHLADLATAHEGIVPREGEVAFEPSLAAGYLEAA